MKIKIRPSLKKFILESLTLINVDSNEAERSAAVIADMVKLVVLS